MLCSHLEGKVNLFVYEVQIFSFSSQDSLTFVKDSDNRWASHLLLMVSSPSGQNERYKRRSDLEEIHDITT